MIVLAGNSPLSALAEIGEVELLKQLDGRIVIPESVAIEAAHPRAPLALREWPSTDPAGPDSAPDED